MTPLGLLCPLLVGVHGLLIGWVVVHYLDGVPRQGWMVLAVSAVSISAVALVSGFTALGILAAAAAAVYCAMATQPGGLA